MGTFDEQHWGFSISGITLTTELGADVIIGPGVHDAHHGHEVVGRAIRDVGASHTQLRWWAWQIWGHLPAVNLVATYGPDVLAATAAALDAYGGENARNNYQDMLHGSARLGAALAAERAFGFGAARTWTAPHASMYCELAATGAGWVLPASRLLEPSSPLGQGSGGGVPSWLYQPSPYLH